jgi:hypothetical protein
MNTVKIAGLLSLTGALLLSSSVGSIAQGLTISAVQKQVPTAFCGIYLPNSQQPMVLLLVEESSSKNALVNVDGNDMTIRQTSFKWMKGKKQSVAVYRGKDLTVTIEAQVLGTRGEAETTDTMNRVTFKRGKLTKTIQSKGACTI